jgi:hypothetical protein
MMKKWLAFFAGCFLSCITFAQSYSLNQFKDSVLPSYGHGSLYDITHSHSCFTVAPSGDTLLINKCKSSRRSDTTQLLTNEGKLVAWDWGEFGGGIQYISNDSLTDTVFSERNIRFLLRHNNQTLAMGGVHHMSQHLGYVMSIDSGASGFQVTRLFSLAYPVDAFCTYQDSLFIVAHDQILLIHDSVLIPIARAPHTATSLAMIDASNIYFGLNGAIARLDLLTLKYSYLIFREKQ